MVVVVLWWDGGGCGGGGGGGDCGGVVMVVVVAVVVVPVKAFVMAAEYKLFISSTFFPNSEAFIAALKTIEILERDNVLENIWEKGEKFMKDIQALIDKYDVGAELSGIAPMFYITFKKDETGD